MAVDVSAVQVGKCFVTKTGQVRRVLVVSQDGKTVRYESRGKQAVAGPWGARVTANIETFAGAVEKEVPAHYDPNYQS